MNRKISRKGTSPKKTRSAPPRPKRTILGEGKFIRLIAENGWEYAERTKASGIVVIVAVTEEKKLLLVEQMRPALGRRVIELPAGLAGDTVAFSKESLATAAARELMEETGYKATKFEFLTEGPPSAGLSTEIVSFFLARRLKKISDGGGDEHEDIQVHEIPISEIFEWLTDRTRDGVLVDPKVYAGLCFVQRAFGG